MKQAEYMGVVEQDGHLSLPEGVREQMHLKPEQVLRVTIVMGDPDEPVGDFAVECLRSMGRNAKSGRINDAASNHDECLYGARR